MLQPILSKRLGEMYSTWGGLTCADLPQVSGHDRMFYELVKNIFAVPANKSVNHEIVAAKVVRGRADGVEAIMLNLDQITMSYPSRR